jgi:hypothetical protein
MSRLYTVHDNVKVVTKILNTDDLYDFLLQICTKYDFITSDMHFSIDHYGPQMIGGRYTVTKQLYSSAY